MKTYQMYICETCRKESRNADEIKTCEAAHLGLTVEEKFRYDGLRELVKATCSSLSLTKNLRTEAAADEAIEELLEFEKKYGISR